MKLIFIWIGLVLLFNTGIQAQIGCTDPLAANYDSTAYIDDGSCLYTPCDSGKVSIRINVSIGFYPEEIHWIILDSSFDTILKVDCGYYAGEINGSIFSKQICVNDGETYIVKSFDDWGDGWDGNSYEILRVSDSCRIAGGIPSNGFPGDGSALCNGSDLESTIMFNTQNIAGCTDPTAINFNLCAQTDDGSCIYPEPNDSCLAAIPVSVLQKDSCTGNMIDINTMGASPSSLSLTPCDGTAENLDVWFSFIAPQDKYVRINIDHGSTVLVEGAIYSGCGSSIIDCFGDASGAISSELIPAAPYFLQLWTDDFNAGSFSLCLEEVRTGCTNPQALNYDPDAVIDDGGCIFPPCDSNEVQLMIRIIIDAFPEEIHWLLLDQNSDTISRAKCGSYAQVSASDTITTMVCLNEEDDYLYKAFDDWGDGWNGSTFEIIRLSDTCTLVEGSPSNGIDGDSEGECSGSDLETEVNINTANVVGCMDPSAANYNPCANIPDGICIYNDVCLDAITIDCNDTITGFTIGASIDSFLGSCGTYLSTAPGVWFTFQGNGDTVNIQLCGSLFDTKLGLFSGNCSSLTCVGGNDDDVLDLCQSELQSTLKILTNSGETYYIFVTGFESEQGQYTLSLNCNSSPCGIPGNLSASPLGKKATLSWDAVPGAVGYEISGNKLGSPSVPPIVVGSVTSFTTGNDLEYNTKYYWSVKAICSADHSIVSEYADNDTFMTDPKCAAPDPIFESNITSTSATLNWTALPYVVGYKISGKQVGTSSITMINIPNPVQTSLNATGLTPSTSYQWTIQSFCNGQGFSPIASPSIFTTSTSPYSKKDFSKEFQVFPNPLTSNVFIQTEGTNAKEIGISLWDASGRYMHYRAETITSHLIKLDLSLLADGLYQLLIISPDGSISTFKLIKDGL